MSDGLINMPSAMFRENNTSNSINNGKITMVDRLSIQVRSISKSSSFRTPSSLKNTINSQSSSSVRTSSEKRSSFRRMSSKRKSKSVPLLFAGGDLSTIYEKVDVDDTSGSLTMDDDDDDTAETVAVAEFTAEQLQQTKQSSRPFLRRLSFKKKKKVAAVRQKSSSQSGEETKKKKVTSAVRQNPSSRSQEEAIKHKKIRFGRNQVHSVPSFRKYPIWWTKQELDTLREQIKAAYKGNSDVNAYAKAYSMGYLHCQQYAAAAVVAAGGGGDVIAATGKSSNKSRSKQPQQERQAKTADACMQAIAHGLADGYQGLERFFGVDLHRKQRHRSIVQCVVAMAAASSSSSSATDKCATTNTTCSCSRDEEEELLRTLSVSLTDQSAKWAAALGQAAHCAALLDAKFEI